MVANLVAVVAIVAIFGLLLWLGLRSTRRPPMAPDLRRADDAEASMPPAAEITEQVSGTVTQSWPVK